MLNLFKPRLSAGLPSLETIHELYLFDWVIKFIVVVTAPEKEECPYWSYNPE